MSEEHPAPTVEIWEREDTWQSLAIGAAVILLVGFVAGCIWVIVAPDDHARLLRVQISAPFGVFGAAVVTFCTIVWRGLISKRQADAQLKATNLQREQIDRLANQIAATEENSLADLLQRGAELIGEGTKKSHVAAGIAILQSVLEAPNGKFAAQAMNLLADFVQDNYEYGDPGNMAGAAIAALAAGANQDRYSTRRLIFDARSVYPTRSDDEWIIVTGVALVRYLGGKFEAIENRHFGSKTKFFFSEVTIEYADIDLRKARFSKCIFDHCEILGGSTALVKRNTFNSCDFSNATIGPAAGFPDLRAGMNYYSEGTPPVGKRRGGWDLVLSEIASAPDGDDEDEGP